MEPSAGLVIDTRIAFHALSRAAAVELLTEYAAFLVGDPPDEHPRIKLSVYPARPATLAPTHAFVDGIREDLDYPGQIVGRVPIVDVIVVHGSFDSLSAVTQRDEFVDGFVDWVLDRVHAVHGNTTIAIVEVEDIPTFVPEWMPEANRKTYYATRFALRVEGWTA